ncbi:RHS repeat-associated core domain-containing protein [Candidatus Uabimicrobium sp. HlEnr_7]|uniref:RHS repeat-associated core domain-containing protein n=1 Tax=Candidatus Uabimicrobium helgolandensis TaxID=3095367 RepID=UPI003557BF97
MNENDNAPDGLLTSFIDYNRNSQTTFTTDPSPLGAQEITTIEYDGVNRAVKTTSAEGDIVTVEFDSNSNPVAITTIENNPEGDVPSESFTTRNVYDSLNRLTITINNVGEANRFSYDSRNLQVKTSDAQEDLSLNLLANVNDANGAQPNLNLAIGEGIINLDGNTTEIIHDGLGRVIQTIKTLRIDGQGGNPIDLSNPSNIDGKIIETTIWDDNSRVKSVQDDNLNITSYEYDNLNRLIKTIWADSKETTNVFDQDSNLIQYTDNNGSVCTMTYDALHRLVKKEIFPASNIEGTTIQEFEYDGLSRLVKASDNNLPQDTTDDSIIERKYDSLGRVVEEIQNGKVISMNWRESGDLVECIYPNNRKIVYSYDKLNRVKTIADEGQSPIASYKYIGSRLLERVYKNNTRLTMMNNAGDKNVGYDGAQRLTKMRHLKNNKLIVGYKYTYNRESFKTSKENLKNSQFSELYKLDSLYRLVDFKRGTLNETKDATVNSPIQSQDWQLDGTGNWAKTTVDGIEKEQQVNNMNEYDSFDGVTFVHDDNGNLVDDGKNIFTYDALNRIIKIERKSDNQIIATYKYDFLNRRIQKDFQTQIAGNCNFAQGEASPDTNTLILYHYNNASGPIIDAVSNDNDINNTRNSSRDDGLFNTRALRIQGRRLKAPLSDTFNNIQDQLTVETFVFLDPATPEEEQNIGGPLVKRAGSYRLKINKTSRKPVFVIDTLNIDGTTTRTRVKGDVEIPLQTWVHLAGVYDGQTVKLFVNGIEQQKVKNATGGIFLDATKHNRLGNKNFFGLLEETRVSNIARVGCEPGEIIFNNVRRSFFYSGWRVIEEREQKAEVGKLLGEEIVSRQFVDGPQIDEHLQMIEYNEEGNIITEKYFHQNSRNDTVAVTDSQGDTVFMFEYSTYGVPFLVSDDQELEEFSDFSEILYLFHGRRVDEESSLMYFRNRYYNPEVGRWLQRDPLGYVDSYGLYEAFGGNPYNYIDPMGTERFYKGDIDAAPKRAKKASQKLTLREKRAGLDQRIRELNFLIGLAKGFAEPLHLLSDGTNGFDAWINAILINFGL